MFNERKKIIIEQIWEFVYCKVLGIKLSEFTTSYRGFNLKNLKNFNLDQINSKGYSFFMGTVIEIYVRKFSIKKFQLFLRIDLKEFQKFLNLRYLEL